MFFFYSIALSFRLISIISYRFDIVLMPCCTVFSRYLFIFQISCEKKSYDVGEEMKQLKSKVGCVAVLDFARNINKINAQNETTSEHI